MICSFPEPLGPFQGLLKDEASIAGAHRVLLWVQSHEQAGDNVTILEGKKNCGKQDQKDAQGHSAGGPFPQAEPVLAGQHPKQNETHKPYKGNDRKLMAFHRQQGQGGQPHQGEAHPFPALPPAGIETETKGQGLHSIRHCIPATG